MAEFKIGDKVRTTEAFAEDLRNWAATTGREPEGPALRAVSGEMLEIVRVDPADSTLPFPLGAQFVEGEKYADMFEDHMAFSLGELEHVED